MDWFRSHHGAPTDPKWLAVAKRSETHPYVSMCCWWALMDHASQQADRGSIAGFDLEAFAAFSGLEQSDLVRVLQAFEDKKMLCNQRIANWDKRQQGNSTERVRRHRNAVKRDVTLGNDRGEEIRVDKKNISPSLRSGESRTALSLAEQEAFQSWWHVWPNKVGKAPAAKAFKVALTKAPLVDLVAGAERYAARLAQPNAPTPKHPQGWLNDERWNDQLPTAGAESHVNSEAHETEARRSAERVAIVVARQQRRLREGLGVLPDRDAEPVLPAVSGG